MEFVATSRLFDLTGQVAVVTGATRGIGQATALRLADAGAAIVNVASTAAAPPPFTTKWITTQPSQTKLLASFSVSPVRPRATFPPRLSTWMVAIRLADFFASVVRQK